MKIRSAVLFGSLAFAIGGCHPTTAMNPSSSNSPAGSAMPVAVQGRPIRLENLTALGKVGKDGTAKVKIAGAELEVRIKLISENQLEELVISRDDVELERESYKRTPKELGATAALGSEFVPPITLLKTPMTVGDSWTWKGTVTEGGPVRNATATIKTSADRVELPTSSVDAIRVDVDLAMESGGPNPAKRTLIYWCAPGHGVIQRKFGSSERNAAE